MSPRGQVKLLFLRLIHFLSELSWRLSLSLWAENQCENTFARMIFQSSLKIFSLWNVKKTWGEKTFFLHFETEVKSQIYKSILKKKFFAPVLQITTTFSWNFPLNLLGSVAPRHCTEALEGHGEFSGGSFLLPLFLSHVMMDQTLACWHDKCL